MGPKYQRAAGDLDDSVVYSGEDADNEFDNILSPREAQNNLLLIDTRDNRLSSLDSI